MKKNYIEKLLKLMLISVLLLFIPEADAQEKRTITGMVINQEGEGLVGANVRIKGTVRGTSVDADGSFSLDVMPDDETIVVSYIGFESVEINIVNKSKIKVTLVESAELEEVVVTALGVSREEKGLGYAVQKLDSKTINSVPTNNFIRNLSGRVAGVYITNNSSGPTSSSNVTIRGETSLTGNSQALFVVDGTPITNGLFSPGDGLNGSTTIDFGNAAQIVNPHDIQNISVLKGPAAAALYGSRAANGVILITTKDGTKKRGWGVELHHSTYFESPLRLPDYQNEYGFGGYGKFSYNGGQTYTGDYYDAFGENWGPRTDGTPIKQWNSNGEPVPFTPAEDNVRNFYRTGVLTTTNVALSNSSSTGNFRLSYTNQYRRGVVPNTDLKRNTLSTSIGRKLFDDWVEVDLNTMYVGSSSDNVPNAGYDESSSIMYGWLWYPRQVEIDDLRDYWKPGQEDVQQRYIEELWVNNPWFVVNENTNAFNEDRFIGDARVKVNFTDFINLRFRYGFDIKNELRQFRRATSTKGVPFGSYREDKINFRETNAEVMLSFRSPRTAETDLTLDVRVGGNIMRQESDILVANNPQLLKPGLFTLTNNRSNILVDNPVARKGISSLFGLATLAYQNFLYLDVTARNDWSSTLPVDNNSYFYPSVSLSAVISEKLNLSTTSALSFLKVRGAFAQVGNDTDPYLLTNFYQPEPLFGSYPAFSVTNFAANPDLKPERTSSWEIGVDARFFTGRFGFDVTYYDMLSKDQIIFLPVATSTGKETRLANAGEISNTGVELQMFGEPVKNENFTWESIVNIGHNRAVVESLPEGVEESYPLVADVYPGDEGGADLELVAVEGEPLGMLRGLVFARDSEGNIIHEDGLPTLKPEKETVGTYQPDFMWGWQNNFTYKNWSLSVLFDGQVGGKIYSRSHMLYNTGGTITNEDDPNFDMSTLEGRRIYDISYDAQGEPIYDLVDEGGVIGEGVMYDGEGNLVPNTVKVPVRDYFYKYYGNWFNRDVIESATYDATYVKFREVKLTYNLPRNIVERWGIQGASISFVGRNLLLFTKVPTIDPETYSIRNGQFVNGYESTSLPSLRSYGFALNFMF